MESMLNGQPERSILTRTARARQEAVRLLEGLIEERSLAERRMGELRQIDPLKRVTGHSSLDNAIDATRRMIDTLDRSVAELRRERREPEVVIMAGSLLPRMAAAR